MARRPHVLLTADEVRRAVRDLRNEPRFVIDIETTTERPRSNTLRWVGLGAAGRSFLIPCKHPKGVLVKSAHKVKKAACEAYPDGDPRRMTKLGRAVIPDGRCPTRSLSTALHLTSCILTRSARSSSRLLFGDQHKLGHNVKFDLLSLAKYFNHAIPPGPYDDTIIVHHTSEREPWYATDSRT